MEIDTEEINYVVDRCKEENSYYQAKLYNMYYTKIKKIVRTYFNDEHNVEDVVQNIFIKLFKVIVKYNNKGSFSGWVNIITKNYCLDVIRKKKNFIEYSEYIIGEDYDTYNNQEENIKIEKLCDIEKMSKQLTKKYGLVFNMYYIQNMTHEEISEELGINIGTSKSNLHKAKKKIYDKLKNKKYE